MVGRVKECTLGATQKCVNEGFPRGRKVTTSKVAWDVSAATWNIRVLDITRWPFVTRTGTANRGYLSVHPIVEEIIKILG